jgi:hypothetical protein
MSADRTPAPDLERYLLSPNGFADPEAPPAEAASRIVELVREFNADVERIQPSHSRAVRQSREYLVPAAEAAELPPRARLVLDRYAVADALAIQYRDQTRGTFVRLLAGAFFAMLIFEGFAHWFVVIFEPGAWQRLLVWLNPLFWLAALAAWFQAHTLKYQKKYHDYRALAEGLRVQFFWNLLGLPDPIEEFYLQKQQGELEWIRCAIRWWRQRDEKTIPDSPASPEQLTARTSLVRRRWVDAQFDYFAKTAGPREQQRSRRCKQWGAIFFWTSLALSGLIGACEVWIIIKPHAYHQSLHHVEEGLFLATGMVLVSAALVIAYGEKMAFAEHARHYAGTSILFLKAKNESKDGTLTAQERESFRTLGKAALQENGDWLLLHRDRPLEVIVP